MGDRLINKLPTITSVLDDWVFVRRVFEACREAGSELEAYEAALNAVSEYTGCTAVTLFLHAQDTDRLKKVCEVGGCVDAPPFLNIGKGEGLSGWAIHNRKPILLSDRSRTDPNLERHYCTFLSLPLLAGNRSLGVLNLGDERPQAINKNVLEPLMVIADHLALIADRMFLSGRLVSRNDSEESCRRELAHLREQSLAQSQRSVLADLLADITCQINNPLSVITGNVQCLVAEGAAVNQKTLFRLRRIEQSAIQISAVNGKLLNMHSRLNRAFDQTVNEHKHRSK